MTDVIAGKDIAWAVRQGANDRNSGTEFRRYKDFLGIYKLPRSPFTLRMWNAYLSARQPTPKNVVRARDRRECLVRSNPPPNPIPAVVGLEWAVRQGRADRIAGKACLGYKTFLCTYGLRKSNASHQLWSTYQKHAKPVPLNTPPQKPLQKSRWTRGLTLSDATTRRRTIRRYDRVEPRRSELSPKNAALLMKVNQQDTLVDMWR